MNLATKLSFAAIAIGATVWLLLPDDAARPKATHDANTVDASARPAVGGSDAATVSEAERQAAAPQAVPDAWLAHPYTMTLAVRVIDALGLPVEGHRLQLAPFGCPMNDAEHATDADGRVQLTWRTRTTTMEIDVAEPLGSIRRRLTIEHGRTTNLVLLGRTDGGGPTFRLFTSGKGGNAVTGNISFGTNVNTNARVSLETLLSKASFKADVANPASDSRASLHPFAKFTEDCLRPVARPEPASESVSEMAISLNDAFGLGELTFAIQNDDNGKPPTPNDATAPPKISGTVFGEDGKPLQKQVVALLGSSPQPLQRTQTDEHGAFTFENVQAGTFTVRAGGDRAGLGTTSAAVTTGTTPVAVHLRTGSCVRGKALDAGGKPLANARLEWRAADGTWCDTTLAGDDGTFVFANLPGGPGSVLLFPPDDRRLPIAWLPAVLPDSGEQLVQPKDANGAVKVQPLRVPDLEAPAVRCWQLETGMAMRLRGPQDDDGDTWTLDRLPAGFYEFEAHVVGVGRRSLGKHWLDGKGELDLGRVELPRDGEIVFELPADLMPAAEDQRAWELCMLRKDADVRALDTPPPLDRAIRLPVGEWVFAYQHRSGTVRFHRFTVRAGERTAIAPKP